MTQQPPTPSSGSSAAVEPPRGSERDYGERGATAERQLPAAAAACGASRRRSRRPQSASARRDEGERRSRRSHDERRRSLAAHVQRARIRRQNPLRAALTCPLLHCALLFAAVLGCFSLAAAQLFGQQQDTDATPWLTSGRELVVRRG